MENIVKLKYNMEADKLKIQNSGGKNIISKILKEHKTITFIITSVIILSLFNFYLIYNFINLLETNILNM